MKFDELILVLNCHTFDDFPIYHEGDEAEGLLAGWSALWHPALLACAGKIPTWCRVDSPPEELKNRLLVVPATAAKELPAGFADRVKSAGGFVISSVPKRADIVAAALAELRQDAQPAESEAPLLDAELVADFLALGYCHLQTELLTRRMRYMSVLDEGQLTTHCVAGAQAVLANDPATARESLSRCFSLLAEAKAHFYPVDAYLVDLTLVAGTTLGESLRAELRRGQPTNIVINAATLEQMSREQPETMTVLRAQLETGMATLIGGDYGESDLSLRSCEAIAAELQKGLATYERLLERRPVVYARRKFGLTPALPQILSKLGFIGALHTALDDGRFPTNDSSKLRWEGIDGSAIDGIGRAPFDASDPTAFLQLSDKMGHTMDHDHVAAMCFAHWPGLASDWYQDLRRMAKYAPALGRFITLNEFFQTTDTAGYLSRYEVDEYRSPYLQQAVARRQENPLSSCVREYRAEAAAQQTAALQTLSASLTGQPANNATDGTNDGMSPIQSFAAALPREKSTPALGILVANPASYPRRIAVDVSPLPSLPAIAGAVQAAAEHQGIKQALVEVPALGFAWLELGAASSRKSSALIATDNILTNDLMTVTVNPATGSIHAIHDHKTRGNRFSQQLALRMPAARKTSGESWSEPDDAVYSVMACDALEVVKSTPLLGEIVTRGRLLHPEGQVLGKFEQRTCLWQGSRVVRLDFRIELSTEFRPDPWNSYVAARFAWTDSAAEIFRSVHGGRHRTDAKRLEAPLYIDIQEAKTRTTILCGGLPYHRRIGSRRLDTLLIVKGETAQNFQLGIGIDLPQALPAALDLLTDDLILAQTAAPPAPVRSGWLFHVDARNVLATHWEPLLESGRTVGFRVRLLETEGRSGRVNLRAFRNVESARSLNLLDEPRGDLPIEGDRIQMDFAAHEWQMVEARWKT